VQILLVGYMYGRGGIQTHTHYLATGLTEFGHDVTVVTPPPTMGDARCLRTDGNYRLVEYGGVASVLNGLGTGRKRVYDVTIVCGTGWKAMIGALGLPHTRKRVFFEVMSGVRSRRFDPRMLVHAGFDAIVGQARPVEAKFCEEFNWSKVSRTIPALPEPLERACSIPPRNKLPLRSAEGLRLAYFGRLDAHKGVGFLVDKWPELSEFGCSLDLFGRGPQDEELQGMIKRRNFESFIRLRGAYPAGADYVALLQQYDLKLLPTTGSEGAPLVLLEAMACGVPFVANGVGGIPDYANADCAITDGNIDTFMPLVHSFAARLRAGEINSSRLQSHYFKNFSFAALTHRWDSFLKDLTGGEAVECA
jgi:glycosyltransferase involved in cell wall biosynthesis